MFSTYWEPAAPGGKLIHEDPSMIGYKSKLVITCSDVMIELHGDGTYVSFELLVPEGRAASFVSEELELYEDQAPPRMFKFTMTVWDPKTAKPFEISPMSVMHGENTNVAWFGGPKPRSYPASVRFGGANRAHYSVKLPPLKVGDRVFDIPVVEFTQKEGFAIWSINGW